MCVMCLEPFVDGEPRDTVHLACIVAVARKMEIAGDVEHAAKSLAANLTDEILETLRDEWGNTNVAVIKHWRDELKTALAGGGPITPYREQLCGGCARPLSDCCCDVGCPPL